MVPVCHPALAAGLSGALRRRGRLNPRASVMLDRRDVGAEPPIAARPRRAGEPAAIFLRPGQPTKELLLARRICADQCRHERPLLCLPYKLLLLRKERIIRIGPGAGDASRYLRAMPAGHLRSSPAGTCWRRPHPVLYLLFLLFLVIIIYMGDIAGVSHGGIGPHIFAERGGVLS